MIALLAGLWACGVATDAWDVSYKPAGDADVDSVKEALDELYVKCRARDEVDEARTPLGSEAENLALRVQVLELKVEQLETEGLYDAGHITYDPSRTTMSSKSVQDALTELENRVAKMADDRVQPGVPGEGLFELRDGRGGAGGGGAGAPGGQGGQLPPNTMGKAKGGSGGQGGGGQGGAPGGPGGGGQGGPGGGGQGGPGGGGQGGPGGGGQPPPQP